MNDTPVRLSDPETWLDRHGDSLYRFALLRVREPSTAEDLVQETLLAAWRAKDRFAGGSAERTWLIAILKNKIIDHYRRTRDESPLPDNADTDDAIDALFAKHSDHWVRFPAAWANPDDALEQAEFWRVFQDCLTALPVRQAQLFTLSEIDGLSTDELCKVSAALPSNVWVILHRARLRLRDCLEKQWFGAGAEKR
jgi:RNA polymerase sigma-70 factor (ECF subfamily)